MFREASSENLEVMHWVVHNSCGRLAAVSVSPIGGYTHLNPSRKGARVGIKFGDAVAGVRLRKPPRDRHDMRIPAWHVQAAISRQTKRARMRFIAAR